MSDAIDDKTEELDESGPSTATAATSDSKRPSKKRRVRNNASSKSSSATSTSAATTRKGEQRKSPATQSTKRSSSSSSNKGKGKAKKREEPLQTNDVTSLMTDDDIDATWAAVGANEQNDAATSDSMAAEATSGVTQSVETTSHDVAGDDTEEGEDFELVALRDYVKPFDHRLPKKVSPGHAYVSVVWEPRKLGNSRIKDPTVLDIMYRRHAHAVYCNNDGRSLQEYVGKIMQDKSLNLVPLWAFTAPTIFVVDPSGNTGSPVCAYSVKAGHLRNIKKRLNPIQSTFVFTSRVENDSRILLVYAVSEKDARTMVNAFGALNSDEYSLTNVFSGEKKVAENDYPRLIA